MAVLSVAPYAAYMSVHTGSLRLEGKGIMNYTTGERRNAGMTKDEASVGIGPDLTEDGPHLSPSRCVTTTHRGLSVGETSLALRYVRSKHPDFIVPVKDQHDLAPYLKDWLEQGIPDRAANLIYQAGPASIPDVAIDKWLSSEP
jgi:hypothetical protein